MGRENDKTRHKRSTKGQKIGNASEDFMSVVEIPTVRWYRCMFWCDKHIKGMLRRELGMSRCKVPEVRRGCQSGGRVSFLLTPELHDPLWDEDFRSMSFFNTPKATSSERISCAFGRMIESCLTHHPTELR